MNFLLHCLDINQNNADKLSVHKSPRSPKNTCAYNKSAQSLSTKED